MDREDYLDDTIQASGNHQLVRFVNSHVIDTVFAVVEFRQ